MSNNVPRLKEFYQKEIIPKLLDQFKYDSIMEVPKIKSIVINMGVGDAVNDKKALDSALNDLEIIAGQKPVKTKAKKSVSSFKVREGMAIGCRVTLRAKIMYEFLDKLINIAIPRIRDFRGMSVKSFDGRGNYNIGLKEQIVFPEIDYDKIDKIRGMNITITTTAKTNQEAAVLLKLFNFPFKDLKDSV